MKTQLTSAQIASDLRSIIDSSREKKGNLQIGYSPKTDSIELMGVIFQANTEIINPAFFSLGILMASANDEDGYFESLGKMYLRRIDEFQSFFTPRTVPSLTLASTEFKNIRQQLSMTQTEFGKFLGGSALRTVQAWESGDRAIPSTVVEILRLKGQL